MEDKERRNMEERRKLNTKRRNPKKKRGLARVSGTYELKTTQYLNIVDVGEDN